MLQGGAGLAQQTGPGFGHSLLFPSSYILPICISSPQNTGTFSQPSKRLSPSTIPSSPDKSKSDKEGILQNWKPEQNNCSVFVCQMCLEKVYDLM